MFWEKKLEQWTDSVCHHVNLPLRVDLWNGNSIHLGQTPPQVIIRIPHASALSYLFTPSLSNLGTAYVEGKIDVEGNPGAIISVGNALAARTLKPNGKFARVTRAVRRTKKQDQESVQYHYDVSNEFYQCWLDENMVYSCAYFEHGNEDLATAQRKKIDHILTKIQLRPGQTLLDIGCGWGALAMRAAQHFGARCVGVTLSEKQAELATRRVAEAGLSDRIEIRLQDYRDVTGTFDRITSVGMFEHVGLRNLPSYFAKIHALLADDGIAMNHGITSTDPDSGDSPYGNGEFVGKYVFPHGELPHIGLALRAMQQGGLEVVDLENLRRHYARTCALWAENFEGRAADIRRIAGERRYRIWRVYLAGAAYAFERDWISLYQAVCVKAGRAPSQLAWSRRAMYPALRE
ncbi:cyclopropane-fatty-acyl-phospholipid synthase [Actimicrobium sp. GrIS 1.19]|uniref:cyclopropane-fatty-acyl-phospholipid synthase family protein n=1 Tax=Actimicrobium sp. GrIS 1.19 TaxID=3071708 RepID=UPI002E077DAC|nr:cyclopropane-fatty-acyl-phospholipid synthase [Actimicrobium sp. GrIS 1.19]